MHLKRLIVTVAAIGLLFSASAFAAAAPDMLQLDRHDLTVDACYAPVSPVAAIELAEGPTLCLATILQSETCAPTVDRVAHRVAFMDATGQPPALACPAARASPPT